MLYLVAIVLFDIITRSCYGILLKRPENVKVVFGSNVTLNCTTNLDFPVFWLFNNTEIFYGGKVSFHYKSMFKINSENPGDYNLVIPSASYAHRGQYTCADDEGEGERHSAWLSVIDQSATGEDESSSGLGQTAIILIATFSVILVLAVGLSFTIYFCKRHCKSKKHGNQSHTDREKDTTENENLIHKDVTSSAGGIQNPKDQKEETKENVKIIDEDVTSSGDVGIQNPKDQKEETKENVSIKDEDVASSADGIQNPKDQKEEIKENLSLKDEDVAISADGIQNPKDREKETKENENLVDKDETSSDKPTVCVRDMVKNINAMSQGTQLLSTK